MSGASPNADNSRLSQTLNGQNTAYTVDTANRLTSVGGTPVTTDANGNILVDATGNSYHWDARGRLTSVTHNGTTLASFTYASNGIRTSATEGGVTTNFTLDGTLCVNEAGNGSNTASMFGPTGVLCRGTQWFTPTAQGSIGSVTDGLGNAIAQNRYGVFGQVVTTNPNSGNPLQFLGGMSDATTGLDYMGRSFYSPGLGLNVGGGGGLAMLDSIPAGGIGGGTASGGGRSYNCDGLAEAIGKGIDVVGTSLGGIAGGFAGGAGGAALGTALAGSTGGAGAALVPALTVGGAALGTGLGAYTGHLIGAALGSGVTSLLQLILHQHCVMFTSGGSGTGGGGPTSKPTSSDINLTPDRLKHILDDHDYSSTPVGTSIWNLGTNAGDISAYVADAVNSGIWTPDAASPGDTWNVSADLGDYVGFEGDHTTPTSVVKLVIKDNGYVVTLYPQ